MKTVFRNFIPVCVLCLFIAFAPLQSSSAVPVFPIATNGAVTETISGAAFDGANYLIGLLSGTNVGVRLFSPAGAPINPFLSIGRGSNGPVLAFDGANYLAVWSDNFAVGVDLFGQLIARDGAKSGAAFPLVANLGVHGFQSSLALAFDGSNYLSVWRDTNTAALVGQFVKPAGTLAGAPFSIVAQNAGQNAALMFNGSNYLLAYQVKHVTAPVGWNTFGQFISKTGALGALVQINQTSSLGDYPVSLAFDGADYLVVWNHNTGVLIPTSWNVLGRIMSAGGSLIGAELTMIPDGNNQYFPSLAFDGANHLLCWNEGIGTTNSQIKFQFFKPGGQSIGSPFTIFTAQGANPPAFAGLFFDGNRFTAGGILGAFNTNTLQFASGDVYGAFIPRSAAPPQLGITPPFTNGQFRLHLTGTPSLSYSIQTTTNPAASNIVWTALTTNIATNGAFDFTDTHATNPSRLYRALKQ